MAVLAAIFAIAVSGGGIPALRHDWNWPVGRVDFVRTILDATSGWGWDGFGNPRPYFGGIAFEIIRTFLIDVLGPFTAFNALMFLIGLAVAYAGSELASLTSSKPFVRASAAAFALFNPWVYAKIVAGHYPMVLSCAALALIVREVLPSRPRELRTALLVAVLLPQLQFLLLAVPLLLYLAIRKRCFLPLVTALIVSLPIWIGVAFSSRYLATIPYTLDWQNIQSVEPKDAVLLLGYFPGYLHAIGWVTYPMLVIVLLAAVGTELRASRNRWTSWWVVCLALFLLAAMGTRSPLAPAMAALFVGPRISAVFRELYDLLGIVAIGYGFYAAATADRWRVAAFLFAAASGALIVAWFAVPPYAYWVDARMIPRVPIVVPPEYRVAYLPAIQPLSLEGNGSGADPDTSTAIGSGARAINEYLPSYPVNAALARFSQTGDATGLAALGVAQIVGRPWLQTGAASLDTSTNARSRAVSASGDARKERVANAIPLFSIWGTPEVGSLDRRIGVGGVFFGDATARVRAIEAPPITSDPKRSWTSVDLIATQYPEIAQGIGGAATASKVPLRVPTEAWTLVYVRGTLWNEATPMHSGSGAFKWISTIPGLHVFRCDGLCGVIATTAQKPQWPLEPHAARMYTALAYRSRLPWLLQIDVPPMMRPGLLRFNARYDPHWVATGANRHLRIDAAVNGWLLPPSAQPRRIVLVHSVAAVQALFAAVGLLWIVGLLGLGVASARRLFRGS